MNIANILTLGRLVALPVMMLLFAMPFPWAAWLCLVIYIIAAVTDFLDGYIARRYNLVSKFGIFLDPIADKIFVMAVLVMLVAGDRLTGIWIIPPILILAREFLIAGLREYLGPKDVQVPVSSLAKWKTGVQMTALGFLIIGPYGDALVFETMIIGKILLIAATGLTIMTGWAYLKTGLRYLN